MNFNLNGNVFLWSHLPLPRFSAELLALRFHCSGGRILENFELFGQEKQFPTSMLKISRIIILNELYVLIGWITTSRTAEKLISGPGLSTVK